MTEREPVVLVVDDEPGLADLYTAWLGEEYTARAAYDGAEALEMLDERIGVVLLDRRMPGPSGDEVLAEITERELDCQVAMISAVEPDIDVIEMGFDDYLTKPVSQDDLLELVGELVCLRRYDTKVKELFSLLSTRAALRAELSVEELEQSDAYRELLERIGALETATETLVGDLDGSSPEGLFRRIDSTSRTGSDD